MIKFIGIALIILGTTIFGEKCVGVLKTRIRSLDGLVKLIDSMEAKISGFSTPTDSFFNEFTEPHLESSGFLNACRQTGICSAVNSYGNELCLDQAETDLLSEFASELGQYTAAEQIRRCKYFRTELEKIMLQAKEKLPVTTKLLRSSGVMCGILAAVLFI